MSVVYLVTAGEQSDYRVIAAYSAPERAAAVAAEWTRRHADRGADDAHVEEFPFDDPAVLPAGAFEASTHERGMTFTKWVDGADPAADSVAHYEPHMGRYFVAYGATREDARQQAEALRHATIGAAWNGPAYDGLIRPEGV